MDKIAEIKSYYDNDKLQNALELVNEIISSEKELLDAHLWRGKIHYRMQKWGNAINDYQHVLEIDPDNEEAKVVIDMATSILDYFTPDMFNP